MDSIAHTISAIEHMLRLGLTPITDNVDALAELGFERAHPQIKSGYESTIWVRSIERSPLSYNGQRRFARQRAFFAKPPQRRSAYGSS
jgi:hypothetical protein